MGLLYLLPDYNNTACTWLNVLYNDVTMFSSKLWRLLRISSSDFGMCLSKPAGDVWSSGEIFTGQCKTRFCSAVNGRAFGDAPNDGQQNGGQMCDDDNRHKSHIDTCRTSWYQFTRQPRCCPTRAKWTACKCQCRQLQPMITTRGNVVVVLQTAEACGQICGKVRDYICGQKYIMGQMSHMGIMAYQFKGDSIFEFVYEEM